MEHQNSNEMNFDFSNCVFHMEIIRVRQWTMNTKSYIQTHSNSVSFCGWGSFAFSDNNNRENMCAIKVITFRKHLSTFDRKCTRRWEN